MSRRVVTVFVVALLIAAAGIYRLSRTTGARAAVAVLADSVRGLRSAADSCSTRLEHEESELQRFSVRLDSMHGNVRAYEAADPRGVPAMQYREYLRAFEQYQDSSALWDGRVAAVQDRLEQCRALAEAHNELVDSLRARQSPE